MQQNMEKIDRQLTTPFLIRIFSAHGAHHRLSEFDIDRQPRNELNLYTWMDATLGELAKLLAKEVVGETLDPLTVFKFSFRFIYADYDHGSFVSRNVGIVHLSHDTTDAKLSLQDLHFVVGDWLDVAVLRPQDRLLGDREYAAQRKHAEFRQHGNVQRSQDYRSGNIRTYQRQRFDSFSQQYGKGHNGRSTRDRWQ